MDDLHHQQQQHQQQQYNDDFDDIDIMHPYPLDDHMMMESGASTTATTNVPTRLLNLQQAPQVRIANQKRCSLPLSYVPGDKDVVCGRGKRNWNHLGNINFRNVIRTNVQRYLDSPTKNDKTLVVISIVDEIRGQGGRFLKEDMHGRWYDIGDAQARDKVGHSLRDQVTALSRQRNKKEVMSGSNKAAAPEPALSAPTPLMRRPSVQSDSGNEVDMRRSSHFTSFILNTFTRRPSFLAFSFNSRTSSQQRASQLMGGDQQAGARLDSIRRSSNWEFLEGLDDFMEGVPEMGPGDVGEGEEPLDLRESLHPFEVLFDEDGRMSFRNSLR